MTDAQTLAPDLSLAKSRFVYVTFIKTTPDALWAALTTSAFMKQYWFGVSIETDWKVGSPWKMVRENGELTDTGEVIEADKPRHILLKWRNEFRPDLKAEGYAFCAYDIEQVDGAVKLTVTHTSDVEDAKLIVAVSGGWPRILSNLKSLLETGATILS
jgi:uncharacterized protein YndB with AHSA1/START domain